MNLFVFGLGFSAGYFAKRSNDRVSGTVRSQEKAAVLSASGITAHVFGPGVRDSAIAEDIAKADALLISVPPGTSGDPVLAAYAHQIASAPNLRWIGYLSTIGVYGDTKGEWVDEDSPIRPASERSLRRWQAEKGWRAFGEATGIRTEIFRLPGIYGPGRSVIDSLRTGTARRIIKAGQVFNRVHVVDIARALEAAMDRATTFDVYNVVDDEPAPPQDVIVYAAELLGLSPPPEVPFDEARLSAMAASFYAETKRVRNTRLKSALDFELLYPTYREGLLAIVTGA